MAEAPKKQTGKKRNYKGKFNYYNIKGEAVERKNRTCPKCGPAVFLAVHKDRISCGGCGYTEKTGEPEKQEAPKQEKKPPEEPKAEEKKPEEKPTEAIPKRNITRCL